MEIEMFQAIFPKVGLFLQLFFFSFTLIFSGLFFYKREEIKKLLANFFYFSENIERKLLRAKAKQSYLLRSYLFILYQVLLLLLLFLYFKFSEDALKIMYNKGEMLLFFSIVCLLFYLLRQGVVFLILGLRKHTHIFFFNKPFYQSIFLQLLFFILATYFFLYSSFFTFNKFMMFVMIFFLLINGITVLKNFISIYKIKTITNKTPVLFVIVLFDTLPLSYVLWNIIKINLI